MSPNTMKRALAAARRWAMTIQMGIKPVQQNPDMNQRLWGHPSALKGWPQMICKPLDIDYSCAAGVRFNVAVARRRRLWQPLSEFSFDRF